MSDAKKSKSSKKLSKKQLKKQAAKRLKKQAKKQEKAVRKAAKKLAKNLSCANGKKGKASFATTAKGVKAGKAGASKKPSKTCAASDISCAVDSLKINLGTCPCCSKRCPLTKPKCGKGHAVARKKRERLLGRAVA